MGKDNQVADEKQMNEKKDDSTDEPDPIAKRCCTDIFCWVIWVCSISFWGYAVINGLADGTPNK